MQTLTLEHIQAYDRDGYVLVPDVFSPQEIEILLANVTKEGRATKHRFDLKDANGLASKLSLWSDVSDDVFGAVTTSPRVVNSVRLLLREDVSSAVTTRCPMCRTAARATVSRCRSRWRRTMQSCVSPRRLRSDRSQSAKFF